MKKMKNYPAYPCDEEFVKLILSLMYEQQPKTTSRVRPQE